MTNIQGGSAPFSHIRIVGSGLIGTSIALAAVSTGRTVEVVDKADQAQKLADDLLAPHVTHSNPDLVVIAVPPRSVISVLRSEFSLYPQSTFIDVSSVKSKVVQDVDHFPDLADRFIGTHPMAGREIGGAQAAQGDLFSGRAWIITPTDRSDPIIVQKVESFLSSIGATPYVMSPSDHDALMARISHLPQFLSSVLAVSIPGRSGLELAGQGLRDMTRLASADERLWGEIFQLNRVELFAAIEEFRGNLEKLERIIEKDDSEALKTFFDLARNNRREISGKHGAQPRNYAKLNIVIEDKPGQLGALFAQCAEVSANIEDLSIEHSPGQLTGLITLAFSPEEIERVESFLISQGWKVHRS